MKATSSASTPSNGRSSRLLDEGSVAFEQIPIDEYLDHAIKWHSSSGYASSARSNTSTMNLNFVNSGGLQGQCGHWGFGCNQQDSLQVRSALLIGLNTYTCNKVFSGILHVCDTGTVNFSFEVHQFASGLPAACSALFNEVSSKTRELIEA